MLESGKWLTNALGATLLLAALGLLPGGSVATTALAQTAETAAADLSPLGELTYWNSIKDANEPAPFLLYLSLFPNGMFFDPARDRYQALSGQTYLPPATAAVEVLAVEAAPQALMEQPVVIAKPKPAKPKKTATLKKKSSKKAASKVTSKKKKSTQAAAASTKKKTQVASNKSSCRKAKAGEKIVSYKNGCPVFAKVRTVPIIDTMGGGGGGGGGGSGGGGGGGWGG